MANKINLRSSKVRQSKRQLATYGTQTPLSSAAVERGSTRWLDGSRVDIEGVLNLIGKMIASGVVDVTGTLNGSGTNNFDGTNNLSGENHLTGPTDITGDTTVSGKLDVTGPMATKGTLSVEGITTLKSDLNVTAGGKIKAGTVTLDPASGGKVGFANGSIADSDGLGLGISHNAAVRINADQIKLNAPTIGMTLASKPAAQLTPIGIDAAGNIYRIA